ncbi:MAG: hypothetical protein ACRD1K_08120 [Acidimicrobiales bacterium]
MNSASPIGRLTCDVHCDMTDRRRTGCPTGRPGAGEARRRRYLVAGARGGQGTTTVATVLAILAAGHEPVRLLSTRPDDVCGLTGCARPQRWVTPALVCPRLTLNGTAAEDDEKALGEPEADQRCSTPTLTVADLGRLDSALCEPAVDDERNTRRWLVVRGPCYLSLRAAIDHPWQPDGVVLLAEPGRALGALDVTDVLGVPVVAQVPVEAAVARVIDAGLLLARLHRLSAFRSLARLTTSLSDPDALRSAS